MTKKYYLFLFLFLGLLTAFGPFVTDMCLPTLPSMATIFNTSASAVQMGLTTSIESFAFGGLVSPIVGLGNILTSTFVTLTVVSAATLFFVMVAKRKPE